MVLKEFRICMPMTVEEYQRGQLYMISRHSDEQSESGEGVEVVKNEPCTDKEYGDGQYTEKKIHLNKCEKYECPWIPRLQIFIETRYEDNNGSSDTCPKCKMQSRVSEDEFARREIAFLDIAFDKVPDKHYKECEDCTKFTSRKTGRGPLKKDWMKSQSPIMCSYKLVHVKFEVWGMQTKVENYIVKAIRDILLLGHRQAFAWIDMWYDMSFESIRDFESKIQSSTNEKVRSSKTNLRKESASAKDLTHFNSGTSLSKRNSSKV